MEKPFDNSPAETASDSLQERFLEFDLGEESYAIKLLSVKEVIPLPETTPIPNSPVFFVGIMNLRGQVISIIDLRKKLKITPKTQDLEEAVIIVDIDGLSIGLVIDSINKVMNFSLAEVAEVPEVQSQVNAQYIQGVYKGEDKLTMILDLESILNIKELAKLNKKAG